MSSNTPYQGSLFANEFLLDAVTRLEDWREIGDSTVSTFEASVRNVFDRFPIAGSPNESQTEDDLIWPVLAQLGWTASLRQQNLSAHGRVDVPDGLLFQDSATKDRANGFPEEWKRYEFGLAVIESKRWLRPLDRRSGRRGEENAPSTQMLRYLRRVDDLSAGKLRSGILTNGARWRLYYQGARSVSEQFFEVDLAALLKLPGHNEGLFALTEAERHHWLKLFVLVFRREAFLAGATDPRTFHQRAMEEGRFYEERVAADLSALVFARVFPAISRSIAGAAPEAPLPEVREAALILLYRLLFIFYAEDRDLLPVRNTRYDDYCVARQGARRCRPGARTVMTPSLRAPPDIGQPSMIFAGLSIKVTPPLVCRPTTVVCLTGNARRFSGVFALMIKSWPMSSIALSFERDPGWPPLHQLSRSRSSAARIDLRALARTRDRPRRWQDCRPPKCLRA